jgi:hypothetical protein
MKIRMLRDWSWYKAGQVADVHDPLAKNWIAEGAAEPAREERSVAVDRADQDTSRAERAVVTEKRRAK